jgi:hypothetical protein
MVQKIKGCVVFPNQCLPGVCLNGRMNSNFEFRNSLWWISNILNIGQFGGG